MQLTARHTVRASYIGYLTQAITINFSPLLFVRFGDEFGISMGRISLLIAISFFTQLLTDLSVAKFAKKLNTRVTAVAAHLFAVIGLTGYTFLPSLLPPFAGLTVCTVLTAIGGGIVEVLISPIVEACPTEKKSAEMSLLHSFYSWGFAATVLFSTLFFWFVGIEHWRILSCLWAIIPAAGALAFCFVPIYELDEEEETAQAETKRTTPFWATLVFWMLFIMMFASGAAEMAMAQWASTFAEVGLGVNKALGDMLGAFAFAVLMGSTRVFYATKGNKIRLSVFISGSAMLCIVSYLITALSPLPVISLIGCAICGLAVGIMWPGTYSIATETIKNGGVRMFALLAMAGDLGCLAGPSAAGWIADAFDGDLKIAFIFSTVFPVLIIISTIYLTKRASRAKKSHKEV